jgi:5-(carboxyamino)imidazole ribonucleotide synthase
MGKTIGILGAGQLGRMLAQAGLPLGHTFRFFDPSPNPCAAPFGDHVQAAYNDVDALRRFADGLDAVTWEFENVPIEAVEALRHWVPVTPSSQSLFIAQDRIREKEHFHALGLDTAPFAQATDLASCEAAIERIGLPVILKTCGGGYDGKGQARIQHADEVEAAWTSLGSDRVVVEGVVPFQREVSVIVVRGHDGESLCWPIARNHHTSGILVDSFVPTADLSETSKSALTNAAKRLADSLEHVGVLCLECFDLGDRFLFNELAPRVHNSGHWSIDGAQTCQFSNHVRAIAGSPLGPTDLRDDVASVHMRNIIGEASTPVPPAIADLTEHVHWYDKAPRPGRKIGHVTYTSGTPGALNR